MIKHLCSAFLLCVSTICTSNAQKFEDYFENSTLRLDYVLAGNNRTQEISLAKMQESPIWAGRRVNLDTLAFEGNGQLEMTDEATGKVIYCTSFSTLFQEWQTTEEASRLRRSFEHTVLVPAPKGKVKVRMTLTDHHRRPSATFVQTIDPKDILIEHRQPKPAYPVRTIQQSGSVADKIDLVFVAEGYMEAEMDLFYKDVNNAVDALFKHAPFGKYRNRFNILAVAAPSAQSGVSEPLKNVWNETPMASHFSTFYSDRYLMTEHLWQMHSRLAGVPYEHIIILANTPTYGGGGIYNYYMLTSSRQEWFRPVVVHEFGHSFAGLADEYYYDDQYEQYYHPGVEPWEWNITTLTDFKHKWADMVKDTTKYNVGKVGLYEGGGYQSKGVFRPSHNCRMRTNEHPDFCPVCQRALEHAIKFHTEEI